MILYYYCVKVMSTVFVKFQRKYYRDFERKQTRLCSAASQPKYFGYQYTRI